MFGIGPVELMVIAVVALVVVGPKRLPQMMRQAGKFFVQARNTVSEVRGTFDGVIRDAENEIRREEAEKIRKLYAASTEDQDHHHDDYHDHDHHHHHDHDPHHGDDHHHHDPHHGDDHHGEDSHDHKRTIDVAAPPQDSVAHDSTPAEQDKKTSES